MWVRVGDDLPVHPRYACLTDVVCIFLDVGVSSCTGKCCSFGAIVVGGVEVAHAPFLHDELLACLLRFLHIRQQSVLGQIGKTVGVYGDDIERSARKIRIGC